MRSSLIVFLSLFIFSAAFAFAEEEKISITTYYPSPYGVYKELRTFPHDSPSACTGAEEGTIYYDASDQTLMACTYSAATASIDWVGIAGKFGSFWSANGNDIFNTNPGRITARGAFVAKDGGPSAFNANNAGYAFNTETDGGMFSPADGTVIFATNGAERMRLTPSGNMKISGGMILGTEESRCTGEGYDDPCYGLEWRSGVARLGGYSGIVLSTVQRPRITIDDWGFVTIGQPHYHESLTPFMVDGGWYGEPGTSWGSFKLGTGWTSGSDIRAKKDIVKITGALEKVRQLRGVRYNIKNEPDSDSSPRHIGFIGQEVQKVFPELTSVTDAGFVGVAYGGMTPVLVEAIKEQQAMIDSQNKAIAELKKEIAALKKTK